MTAGIPEEQHPGFLLSDCRKCFLGEQLQLGSNANGKEAERAPSLFSPKAEWALWAWQAD